MGVQRQWFSQWLGTVLVLAIGGLAFAQHLPTRQQAGQKAVPAAIAGGDSSPHCALDPPGYLRGRLFGALDARLDWSGDELHCSGMLRPEGRGVRLYFAHDVPGQGRLSVQISIAGRPSGLARGEAPANVTIIDPSGHFFSSAGFDRCWTRIDSVRRQAGNAALRIEGMVYCVGALPSVQDRTSLTLGDLHFAGQATVDAG